MYKMMCNVKYVIPGALWRVVLLLNCQVCDGIKWVSSHPEGFKKIRSIRQYVDLFLVLIMQAKQEFLVGMYCV